MKTCYNLLIAFCVTGCANHSDFELCGSKLYPYYHPELKYDGSFYAVKEHFRSNYIPVKEGVNSGIVRVRFHVNCKGETGNFNLETYNPDYEKIALNREISDQLLKLTQGLQGWIPATNEEGETVDSHKFFSFRIENGAITEILPK